MRVGTQLDEGDSQFYVMRCVCTCAHQHTRRPGKSAGFCSGLDTGAAGAWARPRSGRLLQGRVPVAGHVPVVSHPMVSSIWEGGCTSAAGFSVAPTRAPAGRPQQMSGD